MNSFSTALAISTGLVGLIGVVFGALRFQRDEAGKIVAQQTAVLGDMRDLNDELQDALARTRDERDQFAGEVRLLRETVQRLEDEVRKLRIALDARGGAR